MQKKHSVLTWSYDCPSITISINIFNSGFSANDSFFVINDFALIKNQHIYNNNDADAVNKLTFNNFS